MEDSGLAEVCSFDGTLVCMVGVKMDTGSIMDIHGHRHVQGHEHERTYVFSRADRQKGNCAKTLALECPFRTDF
jgi:hypothetical protein